MGVVNVADNAFVGEEEIIRDIAEVLSSVWDKDREERRKALKKVEEKYKHLNLRLEDDEDGAVNVYLNGEFVMSVELLDENECSYDPDGKLRYIW